MFRDNGNLACYEWDAYTKVAIVPFQRLYCFHSPFGLDAINGNLAYNDPASIITSTKNLYF